MHVGPSSQPSPEQLLRAATQAARQGDRQQARIILRLLTNSYPDQLRGWMGLAELGEDMQERKHALEQVLRLQPDNQQARAALQRIAVLEAQKASTPAVQPEQAEPVPSSQPRQALEPDEAAQASDFATPVLPEELAESHARASELNRDAHDYATPILPDRDRPAPELEPERLFEAPRAARKSWLGPLFALCLVLIACVLLMLVVTPNAFRSVLQTADQSPSLSPSPDLLTQATGQIALASPTVPVLIVTREPVLGNPSQQPSSSQAPEASATLLPLDSTPSSILSAGALLEYDGWRVSLPRSDHFLLLDGAIGERQPRGRFVLALVALANLEAQERKPSKDLFVLIDDAGRRYAADPTLSSSYLNVYGRGLRGDLSLEDALPVGGGYYSVPLLFDVPQNARGLRLTLGDGTAGAWPLSTSH